METRINEGQHKSKRLNGLIGLGLIAMGVLFLMGQLFANDDMILGFIMAGVGLSFVAVFGGKKERWWALIPAWVFGAVGIFLMVEQSLRGNWDAIYWMGAVGAPFLVTYATAPRKRWWALIPTGIFAAVGTFLFLEPSLNGNLDAVYWTGLLAAPFIITFLTNPRERWWALIPAYVFMTVTGFLLFERPIDRLDLVPTYWTYAFAAPFLLTALTSPSERWWGFIPGGFFALIGTGFLLDATGLFNYIIPAAFILGGLVVLGRNLRGDKREYIVESIPTSGPAADRPLDHMTSHKTESVEEAETFSV